MSTAKPSGGYFRSGSGNDASGNKSRTNRSNIVTVSARHKSSATNVSPDAASDKSILDSSFDKYGRIVKTEEIAVNYADRSEENSISYEMRNLEGPQQDRTY